MKWTNEMREVIKNNYPNKSYKEIASLLGVSPKSVERQLRNMALLGLSKENKRNNKQSYTKIGCRRRANNKYNSILSRLSTTNRAKNKHYLGVELRVSRQDFIEWYMPLDFEGASVDRIDKNGHYELSNMQVISLGENIRKDKVKTKNGFCECYKCHKIKPLSEFCKDKRRHNGYSTICLDCERKRGKEKYLKSKKKIMLKVETIEIAGFASAVQALRLPFGKECRSKITHDYYGCVDEPEIKNFHSESDIVFDNKDLALMANLTKNGDEHAKAIRGIMVYVEISAPIWFYRELETYRIGRERLSCESTMHIECRGLSGAELEKAKDEIPMGHIQKTIDMISYQTLRRIYKQRRNHRLPMWHDFCEWIETLPFFKTLIMPEYEQTTKD